MLGDANLVPDVRREIIHRGRKFDFERIHVALPDGRILVRECVRHPGAVVILPILETPDARYAILIRNWRASTEKWLWELPAGTLEPGEDPRNCAARELMEETGYSAATLTPLGRFYTSPGLSDELMWAFVGTGLAAGRQSLEADELIKVHAVPIASESDHGGLFGLIDRGELADGKSLVTVMFARLRGII
jgi:ADP-ribose pyrophosphatase